MTNIHIVTATTDTKESLATTYEVLPEDIVRMNQHINFSNCLEKGMQLNVPSPRSYEPKDSLDAPLWFLIAYNEMGEKEISGSEDNPRIIEYHQTTSLRANNDETPWCSSFINWCMVSAGLNGTNSAAARSWLTWGETMVQPKLGCVVILSRGNSSWKGHVGLYAGDVNGKPLLLAGNQSNSVNIEPYDSSQVLGYRWANI